MQSDWPWTRLAGIALIGALMAIGLTQLSPVRSFENFLADLRISHHPVPSEHHDQIVIIAIDDAALEGIPYTSPVHRGVLGSVLQRLDTLKPRAVAVDILLDLPSEPDLDEALAGVISQASSPVVLASDPGREGNERICSGAGSSHATTRILSPFAQNAALAHLVVCRDTLDDVYRRAPPSKGGQPSLAEALFLIAEPGAALPETWRNLPFRPGVGGGLPFTVYTPGELEVIPQSWIEDKLVLVGAVTPYSGDFVSTPLRFADLRPMVEPETLMPRGEIPGIALHAFSLAGLLDREEAPGITAWSQIPYALVGALLGGMIGASRIGFFKAVTALLVAVTGYWLLVLQVYETSGGTWLMPYSGLTAALLLVAGATFALQEREERERRRVVQYSFAHFLSEDRVKEILSTPGMLSLSAEEREITLLFSDLEGFTSLVDTTSPDILAPILNGYLDAVVDSVVRHGGTVDKIVGDAIHAMFSAPIRMPEHRLQAILCALDIQDASAAYAARMQHQGVELKGTRVGISTGRALVGNFGSSKRFDYTAHGSIVNLAARLEEENKVFGTRICLSASSRVECEDVVYREVGSVSIRGLGDEVRVFEARRASVSDPEQVKAYAAAFAAMQEQPKKALDGFEALLRADTGDGLVRYHVQSLRVRLGIAD